MTPLCCLAGFLLCQVPTFPPEPGATRLAEGLNSPISVAVGGDGRVFVAAAGAVLVLDKGKPIPFATGLDTPRGLAAYQQVLFLIDGQQVRRFDLKGQGQVLAPASAFPVPALVLNDLAVDPESGTLYVTAADKDQGGAVYRISPQGKVTVVTDAKRSGLRRPGGLVLNGASFLMVRDDEAGTLARVRIADGKAETVAQDVGRGGGLAWDWYGRLYLSDRAGGRLLVIPRPDQKPVQVTAGLRTPADPCLAPDGKSILVPETETGTLRAIPAVVPGQEVDQRPLPVETALAFPDLHWAGWSPESPAGKVTPHRPLVLTHACDGSNRVFVATQRGVIHVFPNEPKATQTKVFLDIQDQVYYSDEENEQGFLGLAFHPNYKKTGEFFVFYTLRKPALTNVLCRYRVSKDDPDRADPSSREELLRIKRPFWNHDGGTVVFGPDGYLYLALGDGGAADDPFSNGQNLKTLLAKVLRIDVDHKDPGKPYAVPKDNPFVGRQDACPEVWAYGLRNVWRMAFDRQTGVLWASDVGQNLYEEIDHIEKGGNYGWKLREGLHPFGPGGSGPRPDLIEPIWEYHHDVRKSLTGGLVYRGRGVPELQGLYLYGDYVTTKIWALGYDPAQKRVVANHPLPDRGVPILSFGEDEQGETYLLTYSPTGQGVYKFVRRARTPRPLTVTGESGKTVTVTEDVWKKLPRKTVKVNGPKDRSATYEGVPLAELLGLAGVKLGKELRGPRMANYLLVEAADGYRVVFALPEVDPQRTDNVILLADRCDGKPLDGKEGPYRVIVPHERTHSRWIRQVTRLEVQTAPVGTRERKKDPS
jgi:glucose/arabinose dehydrogenase